MNLRFNLQNSMAKEIKDGNVGEIRRILYQPWMDATYFVQIGRNATTCDFFTQKWSLWLSQILGRYSGPSVDNHFSTNSVDEVLSLFLQMNLDVKAVMPNGRNAWNSITFEDRRDTNSQQRMLTAFEMALDHGLRPGLGDEHWFDHAFTTACTANPPDGARFAGELFRSMIKAFGIQETTKWVLSSGAYNRVTAGIDSMKDNRNFSRYYENCKQLPSYMAMALAAEGYSL